MGKRHPRPQAYNLLRARVVDRQDGHQSMNRGETMNHVHPLGSGRNRFLKGWIVTAIWALMPLAMPQTAWSQTRGNVVFRVTTISYGGKYADKNVGAVWVEDADGRFVKTLKVWAKKRIKHLVKWNAVSGGNTVDAVTSATLKRHRSHEITWACTDVNGGVVADGNYRIFVEFTEDNSAKSGGKPGKWVMVEFTKSADNQTVNPPDETYFKNIELIYTAEAATAPASVKGQVVHAESRQPIDGATVQLQVQGQVRYETQSSGGGQFEFQTVSPGSYTLAAFKDGFEAASEPLTLAEGQQVTGKMIQLKPVTNGASLSGTVLNAQTSQPVSGATVELLRTGQIVHETQTDVGGRFAFQKVAAGNYTLTVTRRGYAAWRESLQLKEGEHVSGHTIQIIPIQNTDTTPPAPPRNVRARKLGLLKSKSF